MTHRAATRCKSPSNLGRPEGRSLRRTSRMAQPLLPSIEMITSAVRRVRHIGGRAASAGLSGREATRLRGLARTFVRPGVWTAARSIYRLAQREELRAPFSWRHKLTWWPRGFRADTAAVYDLTRNDWRDYVSDYTRVYRCANINPARAFFDQKLMLRAFLLAKGFPQTETIALVEDGRALLDPLSDAPTQVGAHELDRRLLADGGRFVVKPEGRGRGTGVYLVTSRDGALVRQRGHEVTRFTCAGCRVPTIVERMV